MITFRGIDVRETSDRLAFRAFLQDSAGALVTSGTTLLKLYELQNDGTLNSYDFDDDTFKSGALTTETQALTHRQGDNSTTDTGLWTYALTTVSGFTIGSIYFAMTNNSGASPTDQQREFQFGSREGAFESIGEFVVDDTAFTPTTTEFETSSITTAAADHWIGRVITFTTGTLQKQGCTISDYSLETGRGHFTVTALTSAPANGVQGTIY